MIAAAPAALGAAGAAAGPSEAWERVAAAAEASPRDQAMVEAFEAVSWDGVTLAVRRSGPGGVAGTAIQDMLAELASRALGRPVRVAVEGPRAAPARPEPTAPRADASSRAGDARPGAAEHPPEVSVTRATTAPRGDDGAVSHPFVRSIAELFDATVVRIEAAGTLPPQAAGPDPAARAPGQADAGAHDEADQGDDDV